MASSEGALCLLDLDENVRACVLVYLNPRDLARVQQACRLLAQDARSDVVWATLFLQRFGSDFWGEHESGPHPYGEVPPSPPNKWRQIPPVGVYKAFHQSGDAQDSPARHALLDFVQEHNRKKGTWSAAAWKAAYKRMHKMATTWQTSANVAFLVAGQTSFGRLSAIMDIIKQGIMTGDYKLQSRRYTTEFDPPLDCIDLVSPGADAESVEGSCRVLRVTLEPAKEWRDKTCEASFCVISKPRNWFCEGGSHLFRGLRLKIAEWRKTMPRLHLIYALDCERMDEQEYQELAFKELHGLIGEGKGQFKDGLFLNVFLINLADETKIDSVLKRLKLPHLVEPDHWCPYYAGPVIFLVTPISMPDNVKNDSDEDRETRAARILSAFYWLCLQPSSRPHWNVSPERAHLCALQDERSERERRGY